MTTAFHEQKLIHKQIGAICSLTLQHSGQTIIDEWAAIYEDYLNNRLQQAKPIFLLLDFSHNDVGLTPYLRQTVQRMIELTKPFEGKVAIVVATALGRTAFNMLIMRRLRIMNFDARMFKSPEQALVWLQSPD